MKFVEVNDYQGYIHYQDVWEGAHMICTDNFTDWKWC